ncbi:D(4) dopamine receptor isoform X1 [Pezoporus wallicus]|uniref:D(4) dopamine receptor isoform X1 n=1 Tax=Pezoporus wallicus TaxID=35540 RepID=UPI00254E117F|nr:D(4) dopamine receptor isoform X1 [Pezoporus wallicus]XP_061306924.1 D(4) dopamine receptor isoform X1 [Pezoporus flaviventris]
MVNGSAGAGPCNGTALPPAPPPPAAGHNIAALVLGIVLILLIVGGNGLVCLSVCTERALKTTTNYFIVSLAVADLLLALLVLPLYVYSEQELLVHLVLSSCKKASCVRSLEPALPARPLEDSWRDLAFEFQGGVWSLSTALCDALMTMDVMLCTASIFNLCAISVDRFIAVSVPLNYNRRQIDLRQLILISTTWIFAFAVASPVIFGLNNVPNRDPSSCQLEDDNYIVYSSICSFFIPCPVMLVLYCAMFQGLKRWEEARKAKLRGGIYGANRKLYQPGPFIASEQTRLEPEQCNPYALSSHPGDCGMSNGIHTVSYPHLKYPQPGHSRKQAKINGRERKAMRVLPVVVGAFLFCWTPFFVVHITKALCKSCAVPTQVTSTVTWLGYVNSALNPIIYTVFNAEFRNFFRKVLHLFC